MLPPPPVLVFLTLTAPCVGLHLHCLPSCRPVPSLPLVSAHAFTALRVNYRPHCPLHRLLPTTSHVGYCPCYPNIRHCPHCGCLTHRTPSQLRTLHSSHTEDRSIARFLHTEHLPSLVWKAQTSVRARWYLNRQCLYPTNPAAPVQKVVLWTQSFLSHQSLGPAAPPLHRLSSQPPPKHGRLPRANAQRWTASF